jgi:hypothetical protein
MVSLGNQFFSGISNAAEEFTILNSAQILTPDIKAEIVDVGNYVRFPDGSIQSTAASSGLGATHVLTGDVNKTAGSVSLTGDADSDFYSELFVGDKIFVYNASLTAGEIRTVETIISSLSLTVDIPFNNTASSVAAWKLGPVMTQTANTASLNNIIMGANSGNPDNITGTYNICVGNGAGAGLVGGIENIRIGHNAGLSGTTDLAIAIGDQAGMTSQDNSAIAIGYQAGLYYQASDAIAIGKKAAGNPGNNQGSKSIAIGTQAGMSSQQGDAVAIGPFNTGGQFQGKFAIAIGRTAGSLNQGENAIAIGRDAGLTSQAINSIVINATGSALNNVTPSSCVIKPLIPSTAEGYSIFYDSTSGQLTYQSPSYEPFSTRVCESQISLTPGYLIYVQFSVPTSMVASNVTFLAGTSVPTDSFVGVAIYSNIEVAGTPGRPRQIIASNGDPGLTDPVPAFNPPVGQYSTLSFSEPPSVILTKDTLYWLSIAWSGPSVPAFHVFGHGAPASAAQLSLYDNSNNFNTSSFPEFPNNFANQPDGTWWRIE